MQINSGNQLLPPARIPNDYPTAGGLENEDLSLRQLVRVLRKRKYTVLVTTFVCCLLAIGVSLLMTPLYRSAALIEIQRPQNDVGSLGALASALTQDDDVKTEIQTAVSILQSDSLALETIEKMDFEQHRAAARTLWGKRGRISSERGLPLRDAPVARENLQKLFEKRLGITPTQDTRVVEVSFQDPDPNYAAKTTNFLIGQYIQDGLARRNSATLQASQWMEGEIKDLEGQVHTAQQRLIDFEKQSGLIAMPSSGGSSQTGGAASVTTASLSSPVLNRLMQLNQDLVNAETTLVSREAINQIAKSGDADALATMAVQLQGSDPGSSSQAQFTELAALRQQKNALKLQLAAAVNKFGPRNPTLIDLTGQVQEVDAQIQEELRRIAVRTDVDVQLAKDTEAGVRKAYLAEQTEAYKMNDAQINLAVLQQDADSTRTIYQDLYTKLGESKLNQGTQSSNTAIISSALAPADPSYPNMFMNIPLGAMVGLTLGVLLAFTRETFDDSVVSSSQIEVLTGVPVLASIPVLGTTRSLASSRSKNGRADASGTKLLSGSTGNTNVWLTSQNSQASEAYRTLRTTLLLSHAGSPPRSLLVTSSLPLEGKTTTTYNLASCFALTGSRVLAIDADLRRPSLHKHVRIPNTRGLSNLLTSSLEPDDVIVKDANIDNLSILVAGPEPPNPSELLGSTAFSNLVGTLEGKYDLVMIDSPPSMLVSDAAIMSENVDGVLILVRSGVTTRPALVKNLENLGRSKANVLGFVLNAVDTKSADHYYYNGYYGGGSYYENAKS